MKMGKTRYFTGIILLAVLLAGVLTACAGSRKLSDKFDEAEVKAAAEEVIEILNEGDVDTLVDEKWNTVMKSMVGKDVLTGEILPIVEELGAFEAFDKEAVTGNTDQDTDQEYAVAVIKVQYEKRKAQFTISFDEDMKVGGFFIK
ncbi:hypothetical protein C817_00959 [Dorea sp. 5-2]|nr:hypothetical protein C817_00959 [Dorea sp. 5-2]